MLVAFVKTLPFTVQGAGRIAAADDGDDIHKAQFELPF